jgi:hypothetical protein
MVNKYLFSLLIAISFSYSVTAQNNFSTIDSSSVNEIYVTYALNSYSLKEVTTPKGIENYIVAKDLSSHLLKDKPDVPRFTDSFIIPDSGIMNVEIVSSEYVDVQNINIAPSKGNFSRTLNPDNVPFQYGSEYDKNEFFPKNIAQLDAPYILRDYRGQVIHVFPFQYNPVTKVLRVYSNIKLKIYKDKPGGINTITNVNKQKATLDFENVYKRRFKNYSSVSSNKSTNALPLQEEGKMLIICNDAWMSNLQPFVNWKNTIGRPCELVSVTAAGSTAANIKNYVANYYNNNGLVYLLLVGDAAQVPTNSGATLGGDSDNAYGYINGNDHYQEIFVGRFSAENTNDVATQVDRTIQYENGNQLAVGWLNKVLSVASDQGPGADNELDYEHLRNIQTDLLDFTYENPVYEMFDGSQGNFDAAGNPNPTMVTSALNSGVGVVNYTGHGSDATWGTSGFSIDNVVNLNNQDKLPFIFNVACVNGNFAGQSCYAEAWLRTSKNGHPVGAIAMNASTINQSWSPPMVAQDEFTDILTGISSYGQKKTFGGILANGYFEMNDITSDFAMTDTWTCFGDPSLMIRTADPSTMVVSHDNQVITESNTFLVNCNVEGAFATISWNGQIIGSAYVVNGVATIPVSSLNPSMQLTIAITAFNQVTYLNTITVISPTGSYLVVNSYESTIDYGQTKNINSTIKNIGVDHSLNVSAQITTSDAVGSFTNPSFNFGSVNAGETSAISNGVYTLTVDNNLPDQYPLLVNFEITDNTAIVRNETKTIKVNAPKFTIGTMFVNDSSGNNNGILDPSETAVIQITVTNVGHASVNNVMSAITTSFSGLTFNNATTAPVTMGINGNQVFTFSVTASSTVSLGSLASLDFNITGGIDSQYDNQKTFDLIIGFVPVFCDAGSDTTTDEFIEEVSFNTINNTSVQGNSYSDYTSIFTTVVRGESYPISIKNGEHWSGDQMTCWVDWNYDGDFDDLNELFLIDYNETTHFGTGIISVPNDAFIGNARMRLRLFYTGEASSCGNSAYGEVEDYTIVVEQSLNTPSFTASSIDLYPNPNKGSFTLKNNDDAPSNLKVEVYNVNGQLIYRNNMSASLFEINLNVQEGIYLVKVSDGVKSLVKKMVVLH